MVSFILKFTLCVIVCICLSDRERKRERTRAREREKERARERERKGYRESNFCKHPLHVLAPIDRTVHTINFVSCGVSTELLSLTLFVSVVHSVWGGEGRGERGGK